jgi:hypothetical protein
VVSCGGTYVFDQNDVTAATSVTQKSSFLVGLLQSAWKSSSMLTLRFNGRYFSTAPATGTYTNEVPLSQNNFALQNHFNCSIFLCCSPFSSSLLLLSTIVRLHHSDQIHHQINSAFVDVFDD